MSFYYVCFYSSKKNIVPLNCTSEGTNYIWSATKTDHFSGIYVIFIYITISIKFTNSSMFHDPSGLSSVGFVQRNTSFSSHDLNDDDWIVKTLITGNSSSKLADIYKVHDKNTPRRQYKQCCCNMQHIDPIVNQLDSSIAWMKTSAATNQPTNSSDLCI